MRLFLTLVFLLLLAIPAGISITGCTRNPGENYCNGEGYGPKITAVANISLTPATTGLSLAFGQTRQINAPTATTCLGKSASVSSYLYGTSNNQLVDISPSGNICAGTWNRNSGGGIADYTICNLPNPLPSTCTTDASTQTSVCLPYASAQITASAQSVTSNPVTVYVHPQVTSVALSLENLQGASVAQQCYSQGQQAQLDAQAYYTNNGTSTLLCEPNASPIPDCSNAIGALVYSVGTSAVASINAATNVITAEMPGTTLITASVAGSGSSAGSFSTCPPASIGLTLNGGTNESITQGVQQDLVTKITDTNGNLITGLTLDYQSTNPLEISASSSGAVTASFPGTASIYAVCQPPNCNPAPINEFGLYGTGLSLSSNPVTVTAPGTSSAYAWYAAPGQSQYFVPVDLLTNTVGTAIRLPYMPNSMVMDQTGTNLYFGSSRELMIYSTGGSALTTQDTSAPGKVLAVSPNNQTLLINDQVRNLFYVYTVGSGVASTFGGLGASATFTPDSKTLYIVDNASLGGSHTDALYVYNAATGWNTNTGGGTAYDLPAQPVPSASNPIPRSLALIIPSVGAYFGGASTTAHTWCPSGDVGNYDSMIFYPQPTDDSVPVQSDVLAATVDGGHILTAAYNSGTSTASVSDIGIPNQYASGSTLTNQYQVCPGVGDSLPVLGGAISPLATNPALLTTTPLTLNVNAAAVNQIVASPNFVDSSEDSLAFITYTGAAAATPQTTSDAPLPFYETAGSTSPGTVSYLPLVGTSTNNTPIAGAFSPDNTKFFVSTSGDNLIHYIDMTKVLTDPANADSQQIAPNLPACTPGTDAGCTLTTPTSNPVPATVIVVKPRVIT